MGNAGRWAAISSGIAIATFCLGLIFAIDLATPWRWVSAVLVCLLITHQFLKGTVSIWIASITIGTAISFTGGAVSADQQMLAIVRALVASLTLPLLLYVTPRLIDGLRDKNWLQFRLTSLLFLCLLCGLGASYWRNDLGPRTARQEITHRARKLGAVVPVIDGATDPRMDIEIRFRSPAVQLKDIDLLELSSSRGASAVTALDLRRMAMSDIGIATIHNFGNLEELHLSGRSITDAGLASIAGLKRLRILYLLDCSITDEGLRHLRQLENLQTLSIIAPTITDKGLEWLSDIKSLRALSFIGPQVTEEGVERFRQQHTECTVNDPMQ